MKSPHLFAALAAGIGLSSAAASGYVSNSALYGMYQEATVTPAPAVAAEAVEMVEPAPTTIVVPVVMESPESTTTTQMISSEAPIVRTVEPGHEAITTTTIQNLPVTNTQPIMVYPATTSTGMVRYTGGAADMFVDGTVSPTDGVQVYYIDANGNMVTNTVTQDALGNYVIYRNTGDQNVFNYGTSTGLLNRYAIQPGTYQSYFGVNQMTEAKSRAAKLLQAYGTYGAR
ncbi:hypothetical protein H6771_00485 [Candidatus Peribacteria bacterium]|nr:hypothetical protein [Candidatus Peribacteria bacterium]